MKTAVLKFPQNGGSTPTPCLDKAVHAQGGGRVHVTLFGGCFFLAAWMAFWRPLFIFLRRQDGTYQSDCLPMLLVSCLDAVIYFMECCHHMISTNAARMQHTTAPSQKSKPYIPNQSKFVEEKESAFMGVGWAPIRAVLMCMYATSGAFSWWCAML